MAFSQMFTGWQSDWPGTTGPLAGPQTAPIGSPYTPPVASTAAAPSGLSPAGTSAIGAGVQAAGATLGTIAQLAAQQAALDSSMKQADLGRAASEKMAKMQLEAERELFAGRKRDTLQNMLLSAIQSKIGNILQNRDLRRGPNAGMDEVLARAFLRR